MYGGLRLFGVWGMILAPLLAAAVRAAVGEGEE
jgi:predicted PurR-regulated permease PerM